MKRNVRYYKEFTKVVQVPVSPQHCLKTPTFSEGF